MRISNNINSGETKQIKINISFDNIARTSNVKIKFT